MAGLMLGGFDGYSKEIVEKPIGVVELETGYVAKVDPGCIKFLDNPFVNYSWAEGDNNENRDET